MADIELIALEVLAGLGLGVEAAEVDCFGALRIACGVLLRGSRLGLLSVGLPARLGGVRLLGRVADLLGVTGLG